MSAKAVRMESLFNSIPELNTVEEVAELFRLNVRVIMNMCRDGKLFAVKVGRNWLIPKDGIVEYLEAQRNDVAEPLTGVDALVDNLKAIREQMPAPSPEPELDAFDRPIKRARKAS